MAVQRLADPMAFSGGASLWILPTAAQSVWARKLDWYLNFVAAHAVLHQAPEIPAEMRAMLKEFGLNDPTVLSNNTKPLLIPAAHRLPTHHLVEIGFQGDGKSWMTSVVQIWRDLGRPSVRVFLPPKMSQAEAEKLFGDTEGETLSLVADSTHLASH